MSHNNGRFGYDGAVTGYLGTRLLAALIVIVTLGFAFPYALVLVRRWDVRHLVLGGSAVVFTGRARDLLREWLVWWPCVLLSLGFYSFAVLPRVKRWIWENTDYRALWERGADLEPAYVRPLVAPVRLHLSFFSEAGAHRVS